MWSLNRPSSSFFLKLCTSYCNIKSHTKVKNSLILLTKIISTMSSILTISFLPYMRLNTFPIIIFSQQVCLVLTHPTSLKITFYKMILLWCISTNSVGLFVSHKNLNHCNHIIFFPLTSMIFSKQMGVFILHRTFYITTTFHRRCHHQSLVPTMLGSVICTILPFQFQSIMGQILR